jgi:hypothetical protein
MTDNSTTSIGLHCAEAREMQAEAKRGHAA